jgi:hypothetical protein
MIVSITALRELAVYSETVVTRICKNLNHYRLSPITEMDTRH